MPHFCKYKRTLLILCLFFLNACMLTDDYRLKSFIDSQCKEKQLFDTTSGVEANIKAQREELTKAEIRLGAEQYTKLSHKLDEFERSTEMVREGNLPVCRDWAICQYRFGSKDPTQCDAKLANWQKEHEKLIQFLQTAQSFKVIGPKGTTYSINIDKPTSLEEAIGLLKRIVTENNIVLTRELSSDGSIKTRKFTANLKDMTLGELLNAFLADAQDQTPLSWYQEGKNIFITTKK